MNVDLVLIASIATVVCLAAIIQSAVGFAYALFATPLLIWMGVSLPETIAILAACSFVQSAFGAQHLAADVPWRQVIIASVSRLATMVLGVGLLAAISTLSVGNVKLFVGCVLCLLVAVQAFAESHGSATVHWVWGALAFASSGFLAGICGMGGPPLVLWAMAHDWSSKKIRGFLFAVFAASTPVLIVLLYAMFGAEILWGSVIGLALTPVVLLGTAVGLRLGNQMAKPMLCKIVYVLLLIIGLNSMVSAIL